MIVKVPIYFELEGSFSPNEVNDLIQGVQGLLTQDLIDFQGKKFVFKVSGKKHKFIILSANQVRSRITSTKKTENPIKPTERFEDTRQI